MSLRKIILELIKDFILSTPNNIEKSTLNKIFLSIITIVSNIKYTKLHLLENLLISNSNYILQNSDKVYFMPIKHIDINKSVTTEIAYYRLIIKSKLDNINSHFYDSDHKVFSK